MNETRKEIIIKSLRLFLKNTYKEVSLRDLMKTSGLSKGGFYHYFESKEQLFGEVMGYLLSRLSNLDYSFAQDRNIGFLNGIRVYLQQSAIVYDEIARLSDTKDMNLNIYTFLFDMLKYSPDFRKDVNLIHEREMDAFRNLADHAKETGELKKEVNSQDIALQVHTMMHGISILSVIDPGNTNIESLFKDLFSGYYLLIRA